MQSKPDNDLKSYSKIALKEKKNEREEDNNLMIVYQYIFIDLDNLIFSRLFKVIWSEDGNKWSA